MYQQLKILDFFVLYKYESANNRRYFMSAIVNLFGSAGSGKSTGATFIFSILKLYGLNVEYVSEFAKDKVWEQNPTIFQPQNQPYIFGKQLYKVQRVMNKVDYVITDCPLLLSNIYVTDEEVGISFKETVRSCFKSMENFNFLVSRAKAYNPVGRNQKSAEEADQVLPVLMQELNSCADGYKTINGNITGYLEIVTFILEDAKAKGLISEEKITKARAEMKEMWMSYFDGEEKE